MVTGPPPHCAIEKAWVSVREETHHTTRGGSLCSTDSLCLQCLTLLTGQAPVSLSNVNICVAEASVSPSWVWHAQDSTLLLPESYQPRATFIMTGYTHWWPLWLPKDRTGTQRKGQPRQAPIQSQIRWVLRVTLDHIWAIQCPVSRSVSVCLSLSISVAMFFFLSED